MSQGQRVVSLYRRILRCGHHWQGTSEEKAFILQEAHKRFREAGAGSLDKRLEEGQQRLEYAEHYGIPYPRLHHSRGQFKGRRYDVPES